MAFRRIRRIARHLRSSGPAGVGTGFGAVQVAALAQLESDGEAAFQFVGSALVSTWEVGLTELARALTGKLPEDERRKLVERVSDGLVPVQQPLQTAGHGFGQAVKDGVNAGLTTGQLQDATVPLCRLLDPLGAKVDEGWGNVTEYLEPVFAVLPDSDGVMAGFAEGGPALGAALETHATRFTTAMAALPDSADLRAAMAGALRDWQRDVCRDIEQIVFDRMGLMAAAGRALDAETTT